MPATPTILENLQRQRRLLLAQDERAIRELTRRWLQVERAMQARIELLAGEIAKATGAGIIPDEMMVIRLAHFQSLQKQLYVELDKYAAAAADIITEQQRQVAQMAAANFEEALLAQGVRAAFNRLPVAAFQHMVGHVAGGSPLYNYFLASMQREALDGMMQKLLEGIALGLNPRETARLMRDGLSIAHKRAMLTARTETLRVYRYASLQNYQASSVVLGWKWLSAKDARTCLACLLMDGTEHDLHESFDSHVQCRCAPVPIVDRRQLNWQSGEDWFRGLDAEQQRETLGEAKYTAWQSGRLALRDFAHHAHDPVFGGSWQVASMQQAIESAARRHSVVRR